LVQDQDSARVEQSQRPGDLVVAEVLHKKQK
jgi:hypothetical protein